MPEFLSVTPVISAALAPVLECEPVKGRQIFLPHGALLQSYDQEKMLFFRLIVLADSALNGFRRTRQ